MRRDIQIIFQDPYASLNPRQRVSDILAEPFLIHKLGSREAAMKRAEELLDLVGLSQDSMRKFPHEFSGGQRPAALYCPRPVRQSQADRL